MSDMGTENKFRPKTIIMYTYGLEYKAYISCYPQSRWELVFEKDNEIGGMVCLRNKGISIHLTKEDFKNNWIEVKNGKR